MYDTNLVLCCNTTVGDGDLVSYTVDVSAVATRLFKIKSTCQDGTIAFSNDIEVRIFPAPIVNFAPTLVKDPVDIVVFLDKDNLFKVKNESTLVEYKLPEAEDINGDNITIKTTRLEGRFMTFDNKTMILSVEKSGIEVNDFGSYDITVYLEDVN